MSFWKQKKLLDPVKHADMIIADMITDLKNKALCNPDTTYPVDLVSMWYLATNWGSMCVVFNTTVKGDNRKAGDKGQKINVNVNVKDARPDRKADCWNCGGNHFGFAKKVGQTLQLGISNFTNLWALVILLSAPFNLSCFLFLFAKFIIGLVFLSNFPSPFCFSLFWLENLFFKETFLTESRLGVLFISSLLIYNGFLTYSYSSSLCWYPIELKSVVVTEFF